MNMLNAPTAEVKPSTHEMEDGAARAAMGTSIAVVPLTIPLLTGLILAALAVEVMADGLGKLFPLLMKA
jgi:small neutral amino acid transporter SnatA (MarC family)